MDKDSHYVLYPTAMCVSTNSVFQSSNNLPQTRRTSFNLILIAGFFNLKVFF